MEQLDPVQVKAREYVSLQLGDQVLRLCEMQARLDVLTKQNADLMAALATKAGTDV